VNGSGVGDSKIFGEQGGIITVILQNPIKPIQMKNFSMFVTVLQRDRDGKTYRTIIKLMTQ
jgi:hypothetical protein